MITAPTLGPVRHDTRKENLCLWRAKGLARYVAHNDVDEWVDLSLVDCSCCVKYRVNLWGISWYMRAVYCIIHIHPKEGDKVHFWFDYRFAVLGYPVPWQDAESRS